jgi:hypothetical protein
MMNCDGFQRNRAFPGIASGEGCNYSLMDPHVAGIYGCRDRLPGVKIPDQQDVIDQIIPVKTY